MMDVIILIGDENFSMKDIVAAPHRETVHVEDMLSDDNFPKYTVYFEQGNAGRQFLVYYEYNDAEIEFTDEEKESLARLPYKKHNMIAIDFYKEELVKRIFEQEDYLRNRGVCVATVDGDFLSLEEFVAKGCKQKGNFKEKNH